MMSDVTSTIMRANDDHTPADTIVRDTDEYAYFGVAGANAGARNYRRPEAAVHCGCNAENPAHWRSAVIPRWPHRRIRCQQTRSRCQQESEIHLGCTHHGRRAA